MTDEPSIVEILRAARERITPEEAWTQGRLSDVVKFGYAAPEEFEGSTCFCAMGALMYEAPDERSFHEAADLFGMATRDEVTDARKFADFNDSHTHAEVLAVFDKAIELAEASA